MNCFIEVDIYIVYIIITIFTATLVHSAFGFGSALIMMPVLTVLIGIKSAAPLTALVSTTIHISVLIHKWRETNFKAAWRLVAASFIGIPAGAFLLRIGSEDFLKFILGLIIALFSLYFLMKPNLPFLKNEKFAFLFGLIAGILGGAYNTNGPPVVIYGSMRRWNPATFRATLQGYFFPAGLVLLSSHYSAGLWTEMIWHNYFIVLPFVLTAVLIGGRLNSRMPPGKFDRYIYIFLVLTGFCITFQSVLHMIQSN